MTDKGHNNRKLQLLCSVMVIGHSRRLLLPDTGISSVFKLQSVTSAIPRMSNVDNSPESKNTPEFAKNPYLASLPGVMCATQTIGSRYNYDKLKQLEATCLRLHI